MFVSHWLPATEGMLEDAAPDAPVFIDLSTAVEG